MENYNEDDSKTYNNLLSTIDEYSKLQPNEHKPLLKIVTNMLEDITNNLSKQLTKPSSINYSKK